MRKKKLFNLCSINENENIHYHERIEKPKLVEHWYRPVQEMKFVVVELVNAVDLDETFYYF